MDEALVYKLVQIFDSLYSVAVACSDLIPICFFHVVGLRSFSLSLVIKDGEKLVTIGCTQLLA